MISNSDIKNAYTQIKHLIRQTPLLNSSFLEEALGGHVVTFKVESTQITGAFKIRGVLNALLTYKNNNTLPKQIVAYSSGNHALAVSWAAKYFGIKAKIFMASFSSPLKMQIVKELGAELVVTRTRMEAEHKSFEEGNEKDNLFLHPSDNDLVIAGASTLCYESLLELNTLPDAIFAACGGGALVSGTYLATKLFNKAIEVYAVEPKVANDVARSVKKGEIVGFTESPKSIADGVITLKVSARTFEYLKQLTGIIEVAEEDIIYWTAWVNHLLKINCEPTAALAMAGAFQWLKKQKTKKNILVMISGGNSDQEALKKIWKRDHLLKIPYLTKVSL